MQIDSQESPELPQRKSNSPGRITRDKILLVEGQDEVKFFETLLLHIGLREQIQVIEVGGRDRFIRGFPAFLLRPDFDQVLAYAIIRDADNNHSYTFDSIKGLLERHGQPCPKQHKEFASIDTLKVGIFVIPGNQETGMLESLCLQTVANHPAMACVDSLMACLPEHLEMKPESEARDSSRPYHPKNTEKARLLAFLACLHEPTTSIGLAAQKGYWPFDHEALSDLCNFLKKLAE